MTLLLAESEDCSCAAHDRKPAAASAHSAWNAKSWAQSLLRSLQGCLLAVFLVACGGGGCGGCEACGVAPIPGGFPIEERVPNAAQVRLTSSGVDFIESNADQLIGLFLPGGLDFDVPPLNQCVVDVITCLYRFKLCEDRNCVAHGEVDSIDVRPTAPNELRIKLRVVLDSRNNAGARARWQGSCDVDVDTRKGSRPYVGVDAVIGLSTETELAREGYTKLEVQSVNLAEGEGIENEDFDLRGGTICSIAEALSFLKSEVVKQLENQVGGLLQGALDGQLCTRRGEFGCPTGTFSVPNEDPMATCRYANSPDAECVPQLLGTDGQGDLGAAFLGSISAGTHAPGQFLLASGGDGESVNQGVSLFMYGGFIGTNGDFSQTPAHNPCVPAIDPPPIPGIPRVDTFRGNTAPGLAEPPHVGIGISEAFLDHAGYGMFDAGLLCIGAGTNLSQQLSTGLFSIVVGSLGRLTFPEDAAPLSIALRPQTPPDFTIGSGTMEDPLLQIALENLELDFYVFSAERFIRFMTYEADLEIGINLRAEGGELIPEIVRLAPVGEARVTNTSELLRENPDTLAATMTAVLEAAVGMFAGGLGGFALPDLMGMQLEIPEGGIQGIDDGGESFLGLFANLAIAPGALVAPVDTSLIIADAEIDPAAHALETFGQGALPRVTLLLEGVDAPPAAELEYSVRIDGMPWMPWTSDAEIVLDDQRTLLLQARHVIEARARIVGEATTVDLTPARQELLIDLLAPTVELASEHDGTRVLATDVITATEDLDVRYRIVDGELTPWMAWDELGMLPVGSIEVEVRDEAGNIGHASNALVRGRPNPAGSGCECTVPGDEPDHRPLWALALLSLIIGWGRRRRASNAAPQNSSTVVAGRGTLAASARPFPGEVGTQEGRANVDGSVLNGPAALAALFVVAIAGCDCGGTLMMDVPTTDGGGTDMGPGAPLDPGLLATHLDLAAMADGTLVLAGYSPGNPTRNPYGDLVVGLWDAASESVSWEIVDGVPTGAPMTNQDGWRGGIQEPGDDVGRFASVATADGKVHVAYYDATHGALKFAIGTPGGGWAVHQVDDEGDAGRYASLVITSSGPAIAYMATNAAAASGVRPTGDVRVARASGEPSGASDWTITTVTTKDIPCRAALCPSSAICVAAGDCTTASGECEGGCATDEACVAGTCAPVIGDDWVEAYPEAVGLYAALATSSDGLALVYYDRTEGNIYGAALTGSTWDDPFLIGGYALGEPFVGDSGIGASLTVDGSDVWHVTYVDGAEETLRYARVENGAVDLSEVVDNGTTDGTTMHEDGRHLVGDDSTVAVTSGGEVRVAYQDATAGAAMFARRGGDGEWTVELLDDEDFTGFFTSQVIVGGSSFVATWWRNDSADEANRGNGVRIFTID